MDAQTLLLNGDEAVAYAALDLGDGVPSVSSVTR